MEVGHIGARIIWPYLRYSVWLEGKKEERRLKRVRKIRKHRNWGALERLGKVLVWPVGAIGWFLLNYYIILPPLGYVPSTDMVMEICGYILIFILEGLSLAIIGGIGYGLFRLGRYVIRGW